MPHTQQLTCNLPEGLWKAQFVNKAQNQKKTSSIYLLSPSKVGRQHFSSRGVVTELVLPRDTDLDKRALNSPQKPKSKHFPINIISLMHKIYVLSTFQGCFNQFLSHIFTAALYLACLACWNKTSNYTRTCNGKVNHQYNPCKTMCCTF